MKQVCIKVVGPTDREPIDRTIQPGTTAAELVNDCGLRGVCPDAAKRHRLFSHQGKTCTRRFRAATA